jgi:transposase
MTTDDNNRKTKVTDAELYEILSNVTHTLLDMDFVDYNRRH